MYRNIIVAIDNSKRRYKVLERAFKISKILDAKLNIINCARPVAKEDIEPYFYGIEEFRIDEHTDALRDAGKRHSEKIIEEAKKLAIESGIKEKKLRVLSIEANPEDEIPRIAAKFRADLIILGSRGIKDIQRAPLGGVTSTVMNNVKCDVLVVK